MPNNNDKNSEENSKKEEEKDLLEKSKKEMSKFERARTILYGDRYANVGFYRQGWYNTYTLWRLSKAQVSNGLGTAGRWISRMASGAKNSVMDWSKESGFGEAVSQAGKKVTSGAKSVKNITVKGAKAAGELLANAGQKVYEAGKWVAESSFGKAVSGWAKKTASWFKDKTNRLIHSYTAKRIKEGLKTAGRKIAQVGKGAAEIAANGLDKVATPVVKYSKKLYSSSFGKKVRAAASGFGSKTAKSVKSLAHHAASAYDNVKSRYKDWKFKSDRAYGFEENQIQEMLRTDTSGKLYTEKMDRFRKDVLSRKDVQDHIKIRQDKERIRRNAADMEKGKTGDFELADINEDGKFEKDTPGAGMLQSLNKYDLANVIIPDTEDHKKKKLSLEELQNKAKKEPVSRKNATVPQALKDAQKNLQGKLPEAEIYAGVMGKSVPVVNFAKAFGNTLNIIDGKEKEKNMAFLVSNLMDEAGKIVKLYDKSSSFANLAGALNTGLTGTALPAADADKLAKAKAYIQDIQSGMKVLGALLTEAGMANQLADNAAFLAPVLTIINGVDGFNALAGKNEKLNALTTEDKSLNLTDQNVIRHIDQGSRDLVRQNEVKQAGQVMNTGMNAAISAVGAMTGTTLAATALSMALAHVSPVDLVVHHMKGKTDHELMMEDVFGSLDAYRDYKKQYGLRGADIEREILKETNISSAKEYASRVRAETALHLHSRMKQAEEFGIENGATKLKDAGGLQGKSAKEIYKEIGGRDDFDNIVGRTRMEVHKQKVEDYKKKKAEEYRQQTEGKTVQNLGGKIK